MEIVKKHNLFFVFLVLFLAVAFIDLFNVDQVVYKSICDMVAPVSGVRNCPTYYDIPIWNVYLSLAILAALYHLHGEARTTNRHLSSK